MLSHFLQRCLIHPAWTFTQVRFSDLTQWSRILSYAGQPSISGPNGAIGWLDDEFFQAPLRKNDDASTWKLHKDLLQSSFVKSMVARLVLCCQSRLNMQLDQPRLPNRWRAGPFHIGLHSQRNCIYWCWRSCCTLVLPKLYKTAIECLSNLSPVSLYHLSEARWQHSTCFFPFSLTVQSSCSVTYW